MSMAPVDSASDDCRVVGLIGLGIMGSAIAPNLISAGFTVVGHDIDPARCRALVDAGGLAPGSAAAVARHAAIVITSLPGGAALEAVLNAPDGLLAGGRRDGILIETSTLPIDDKRRARAAAHPGFTVLDCPLSGTGAQARTRDLVVYASGDPAAIARCRPVFQGFARASHDLGEFGNGSRMKFVANLLVAIHNVAAAEAMVLGMKAGLDAQQILEVVGDGAGGSRMLSVRGPQMVADCYEPATMKVEVWQKDMRIIGEFAASLDCPTPLLSAAAPVYTAAMAQGFAAQDTASVCAVLADMARLSRNGPPTREA